MEDVLDVFVYATMLVIAPIGLAINPWIALIVGLLALVAFFRAGFGGLIGPFLFLGLVGEIIASLVLLVIQ